MTSKWALSWGQTTSIILLLITDWRVTTIFTPLNSLPDTTFDLYSPFRAWGKIWYLIATPGTNSYVWCRFQLVNYFFEFIWVILRLFNLRHKIAPSCFWTMKKTLKMFCSPMCSVIQCSVFKPPLYSCPAFPFYS